MYSKWKVFTLVNHIQVYRIPRYKERTDPGTLARKLKLVDSQRTIDVMGQNSALLETSWKTWQIMLSI